MRKTSSGSTVKPPEYVAKVALPAPSSTICGDV
jgi:hypothetical protein